MIPRRVTGLLLAALLLSSCALASSSEPAAATQPFIPVLAASELVVGQNRLPLGIIKAGRPLNDPALMPHLRFFYLDGPDKAAVQAEANAVYRGQGLPVGLYVAYPTLDRAGAWAVEVEIPGPDGAQQSSRLRVDVLASSTTPVVGSKAIASVTPTAAQVPNLKQITSDGAPDPALYQLSVDQAIAAGKPFLLAFSTPGFCKTAVCGPNLEVIKKLKDRYRDQVNFIHVEVYPYPFSDSVQAGRQVPAMAEWNLRSEPWTFLVDGEGVIQAKYEGGITTAEMEAAVGQLAAGQPVTPLLN